MKPEELMNKHIVRMESYACARDEFEGTADVYLDANESWYNGDGNPNRYPDPVCKDLRHELENVLGLPFDKTAIGNGSDEVIDLLIRMFCRPGKDSILVSRPTYGEYKVLAETSDIRVINVMLDGKLELDTEKIKEAIHKESPKLVFICTPNNPTGNRYSLEKIKEIADFNPAITVVDEAYCDFAENFQSAVPLIDSNNRIVVLRTMSKAWALAGARVGILVADPYIQKTFIKIKAPYNVSVLDQAAALKALRNKEKLDEVKQVILSERKRIAKALIRYGFVTKVYPSDTNFLLVKTTDADKLYRYLMNFGRGIIVRNRTHEPLLEGCLRITIGSVEENDKLLEALNGYKG